ncbi:MAG: VOC family protein [Bosea sp. (in: a-proteobacteria)]
MAFSLDHIVIAVTDLDAAMRDYETLGFTVQAGGEHPRGSRNALVAFEDGSYLEIIAFGRPAPDFRWWQVLSHCGSGLVDYALLPDNYDDALWGARARGLEIEGPIDGARLRPDGVQLVWKTARAPEADIPFLCADVTPRDLRVPDGAARQHRNGVTGVAGVTTVVHDLGSSTARYRALLNQAPTACGGAPGLGVRTAQFQLGAQMLTLVEPHAGASDALSQHLSGRGQGIFAVSFFSPIEQDFDRRLTHGARLETVRCL